MRENHDSVGNRLALRLGFFSVCPHVDGGFIGGYLVLNGVGRPLEFHCTTPVKPTRTQEILFGATLKPYLFGEQIGPVLFAKAKTPVHAIFVSQWESLTLASQISEPVAFVCPEGESPLLEGADGASDVPRSNGRWETSPSNETQTCGVIERVGLPPCQVVRIGKNRLVVAAIRPEAPEELRELLSPWEAGLDLLEPFGRIQAALEEASRRG